MTREKGRGKFFYVRGADWVYKRFLYKYGGGRDAKASPPAVWITVMVRVCRMSEGPEKLTTPESRVPCPRRRCQSVDAKPRGGVLQMPCSNVYNTSFSVPVMMNLSHYYVLLVAIRASRGPRGISRG